MTKYVDVLFSFVHDNSSFYNVAHEAMLEACKQSRRCKRFVLSQCGDLERHDDKSRFYIPTHRAFRSVLREQTEIEWTLFNQDCFMDYFLGVHGLKQSYLVKMSE